MQHFFTIRFFITDNAPELSGDDDQAEGDHEEGANDDEHDKVDPVPKRMGILCKNALDGIGFTVNFGTPPDPPFLPDIDPKITMCQLL